MSSFLKCFDIFGAKFDFFIGGSTKYTSQFGALLSLLTILLILAATSYFLNKFFRREESTTTFNTVFQNNLNLDFDKIPIMMRISNTDFQIHPQWQKIWNIKLLVWHGEMNQTDPSKKFSQYPTYYDLETCDIKIHFGKWAYLFETISDINTYLCPSMKNSSESLYGIYGDPSKPYSYYNFQFYRCSKDCLDSKTIDSYLTSTYMDMRTLDYSTDSNSLIPFTPFVRGERFAVSNTVWRRIWMYNQKVTFESDFGYIFEDKQKDIYFQYGLKLNDVDMRDQSKQVVPNSFLILTILNNPAQIIFSRNYLKAQQLIANVGGIIKGLVTLASLVNYLVTYKYLNIHLINESITIRQGGLEKSFYSQFHNPELSESNQNKLVANQQNIHGGKLALNTNSVIPLRKYIKIYKHPSGKIIPPKSSEKCILNMTIWEKILPSICIVNEKIKLYLKEEKLIKEKLDIVNIFKILYRVEIMENYLENISFNKNEENKIKFSKSLNLK